jgi:hypothetical protein
VVVATPALPVSGTAVQQWMWAAVVVPSNPEKLVSSLIVLRTVSAVMMASAVAGDALGGDLDGRNDGRQRRAHYDFCRLLNDLDFAFLLAALPDVKRADRLRALCGDA